MIFYRAFELPNDTIIIAGAMTVRVTYFHRDQKSGKVDCITTAPSGYSDRLSGT